MFDRFRRSTPIVPLMVAKSIDSLSTEEKSSEATEETAPVPARDPEFGASAIIKTFYEGKGSSIGCYNWVDYPPKALSKKVAKAHDRVAIKIYKILDSSKPTISGRTPLKTHAIELQSPVLVETLVPILKEEGLFLESSETARFQEPFKPLFFCYSKILSLSRTTKEGLLKQHLVLLVNVLNELFGGFMNTLKNLRKSGLISYKLAWTYFPRNSLIYSGTEDAVRICRVVDTDYEKDSRGERLAIHCEEIAFDGEKFEWRDVKLSIPAFGGNQPIDSLPNFPLEFLKGKEEVVRRLTERAKKVLEYQELHYGEYEGVGVLVESCKAMKVNVSGRILIDFYGYQKHHEGLVRTETKATRRRNQNTPQPAVSQEQAALLQLQQMHRMHPPQPPVAPAATEKQEDTYVKRLSAEAQAANKVEMLSRPDDLIFVSPILEGFSLKAKLWLNFYVDDIKPVTWNDDAYSHLVYPEEQKDLVLTFVENHQRLKKGVDDVIMGKGQGLILLLSGPPGTGKTLTAEAVADKTRRPLYYLQAEDLGTNPALLGPKIKKVFEMATEWDAVILLDEADVFMAERSPADIARNELVSIFLRELEYFQGIIFLTTNLCSTIDTAFRSRVNIHLLFSPLPASSRFLLWEKFLARLPNDSHSLTKTIEGLDKEMLGELAKWELNGREIKNAIKTVRTWCVCKGFEMNLLRLESGIQVTAPQARKVEEVS